MIISYACLIWIGYFSSHLKCSCISERRESMVQKKYAGRVMFVETNPCTEFWFLLHFLPNVVCRRYDSYNQLLPELQKYMPGYEKTKRYFIRTNLYKYLTENGDLERAMVNSEKLCQLCQESPEDLKAYSEIQKVIELLNQIKQ